LYVCVSVVEGVEGLVAMSLVVEEDEAGERMTLGVNADRQRKQTQTNKQTNKHYHIHTHIQSINQASKQATTGTHPQSKATILGLFPCPYTFTSGLDTCATRFVLLGSVNSTDFFCSCLGCV
jgi:hypothetical protein